MTDPFITLIRAHDKLWTDKGWSLKIRIEACTILWDLARRVALERAKKERRKKDGDHDND
jgi:hypothetical protein